MTAGALSEILAGGYAAQIQDFLGSKGKAVQTNTGAASTSVTSGNTTTGIASAARNAHATIFSLSPAAQSVLGGAEVALSLITATESGRNTPIVAAARTTPAQQTAPTAAPAAAPTDEASLTGILTQAKAALADPSATFYQVIDHSNGPDQFASFFSDPAQRQSFIDAYNNHTLTIQNASDVNGLSYQNTTVLTGTSETSSASVDERWRNQQDAANATYSTALNFPVIGGLYITWPKPA